MEGLYKIAEHYIKIQSLHREIHEMCRDYRAEGHPWEWCVETTQSDIDFERAKSAAEDEKEGIPTRHFGDGYLETLAVYRRIADRMTDFDTILFHGSVIAVDGVGYLFTAKSGTGKSTHTRLWRELFGSRAVMVNDDKPLIRVSAQGATVYGTPWDGKHRLSANIAVPLKALCILERARENRIQRIPAAEAYPMLLQQVHKPSAPAGLRKTLELISALGQGVELFRLGCNMEPEAAAVAYWGMNEGGSL